MKTSSSTKPVFIRAGRLAMICLTMVALTAGMFLFASVLFELDPSGQKIQAWLNASRYGLFIWRLTLYTMLCWAWFAVVRPKVVKVSPGAGSSLRRMEWTTAGFILVLEFAAWRSVLAGAL
ncbi:Metallophosphoesterase [Erwinia rhapontici]|uniref:hypothetical protein n=1 Tax=Erwinia rhapontici TaxID=55212 RepID=UPI003D367858